jgi:hypothetical protein
MYKCISWNITRNQPRRFNVWNCNVAQFYNYMQAGSIHYWCIQGLHGRGRQYINVKRNSDTETAKHWRKDGWTNKQFGFLAVDSCQRKWTITKGGRRKKFRDDCVFLQERSVDRTSSQDKWSKNNSHTVLRFLFQHGRFQMTWDINLV